MSRRIISIVAVLGHQKLTPRGKVKTFEVATARCEMNFSADTPGETLREMIKTASEQLAEELRAKELRA